MSIQEDSQTINTRSYMLDPFSTIVKLAILANKPVGTKIYIMENRIGFQEPGIFQSLCRYIVHSNKTDLQFLYNPIQFACQNFLVGKQKEEPRLTILFQCAQRGLDRLIETYRGYSILRHCLNYYYVLISNYTDEVFNQNLFRKDAMTIFYNDTIVSSLNSQWTDQDIKVILDLIYYINEGKNTESNIRSLESLVIDKDARTKVILEQQ